MEQLTFAEQEMLITLANRLKLKETNNTIERRKLIVIHNLMNINRVEDIKKFIDETLLKSMTFSLEPRYVKDPDNTIYNITVYDQMIENNDSNKLDIVHIIIGDDKSEEVRNKYNEPAIKYIRDAIKIDDVRKFDIINSFKDFIKANCKKFINNNLFDDNSLEIGEEKRVKVFTNKEKTKKSDKIIKPIEIKDKSKINDFTFKNFFYDSSGVYYSSEPLYSSRMTENNGKYYLEITFEMYGKLNEKIATDINYDDNNNKILIEIRGKTEECMPDFFKGEGKREKEKGNLKYTEFVFQVIIEKYRTMKGKKYELEIENNPQIKIDDISGIECLIFPVDLFEI